MRAVREDNLSDWKATSQTDLGKPGATTALRGSAQQAGVPILEQDGTTLARSHHAASGFPLNSSRITRRTTASSDGASKDRRNASLMRV